VYKIEFLFLDKNKNNNLLQGTKLKKRFYKMNSQVKNLTDMPIDIIKKINNYRPKKVYFPLVVSFDDGHEIFILKMENDELSCKKRTLENEVNFQEIYFENKDAFKEFIFFKFSDYAHQDLQDMGMFTIKIYMSNLMSTTLYIDCVNDQSSINHVRYEFEKKVKQSLETAIGMLGKMYRYE
jgi:hypothetical protein